MSEKNNERKEKEECKVRADHVSTNGKSTILLDILLSSLEHADNVLSAFTQMEGNYLEIGMLYYKLY